MKIFWQNLDSLKKVTEALQQNKVLITTTDTVPGFLASVTQQSFDKLNYIKGDRQSKPYIILISDSSKLKHFVDMNHLTSEIQRITDTCWPGPLTLVFKSSPNLPTFLKSQGGTVAIRCPKHQGLLGVLQNFSGLFSTSANKSLAIQPATIDDIDPNLVSKVKLMVDEANNLPKMSSSTILDVSKFDQDKKVYLLRQGAYPTEEIEKTAGIFVSKL